MDSQTEKPIVVVTGVAGAIGTALARALAPDYTVVGLDLDCSGAAVDCIEIDLTSGDSVELALRKFRERYGSRIASVIHLVAFFDFTGEDNPLYERSMSRARAACCAPCRISKSSSSSMRARCLSMRPGKPGEPIDERQPIEPNWAYPKSKAAAEG